MTLDRRRALRALTILAWALFFDWLWLSGEASRYVGSRTAWVVPFGGIVLTCAAVLQLLAVRGPAGEPPRRRDLAGLALLLAPVLTIAVIPAPTLGSLAVEKKQSNRVLAGQLDEPPPASTPIGFEDFTYAAADAGWAKRRGMTAGRKVELTGIIAAQERGSVQLARFSASCCAADAIPFTVRVQIPAVSDDVSQDSWVTAKGSVQRTPDGEFYVVADTLTATDEPRDVYLQN